MNYGTMAFLVGLLVSCFATSVPQAGERYQTLNFVDSGDIEIVSTKDTTNSYLHIIGSGGLTIQYPIGYPAPLLQTRSWGIAVKAASGYSIEPGECIADWILYCEVGEWETACECESGSNFWCNTAEETAQAATLQEKTVGCN